MSTQKSADFSPNGWLKNGSKPYEQMDDLGGKPPIFGKHHL